MLSLKIQQSSESEEELDSKKKSITKPKLPIVNEADLNKYLFDNEASPQKSSYSLRNGKVKPKQTDNEPEGWLYLIFSSVI
jgi:hypothetical protein